LKRLSPASKRKKHIKQELKYKYPKKTEKIKEPEKIFVNFNRNISGCNDTKIDFTFSILR
jgi:hypothetical protein